eukprot:COSAG05_NODE_222_length_13641_cov_73.452001_6_plen_74_part_00
MRLGAPVDGSPVDNPAFSDSSVTGSMAVVSTIVPKVKRLITVSSTAAVVNYIRLARVYHVTAAAGTVCVALRT